MKRMMIGICKRIIFDCFFHPKTSFGEGIHSEKENLLSLEEKENMKAHRVLLVAVLFVSASLAFVGGCNYNVSDPLWNQPYTGPPAPLITSVDPASEARPGVNTIVIHGHNFIVSVSDTSVPSSTIVYFNTLQAEIVSMDSNTIVVRRPNLVGDSCTIKVAPHNAIVEATYSPYRIYPVYEKYGGFLQNIPLGALAVDNSENLYVIETTSKYVHKVAPDGENVILGGDARTAQSPYGACIGPDGNLYVTENNRSIDKVDLTAGTVARWTQLPSGKVVKVGDFGPGGYFYTGGTRTDLCIVPPNPPTSLSASQIKVAGSYATDEILAIRVYSGYVYVASRAYGTQNPPKIWRNQIVADSVGPQQLVLDMDNTATFASRVVNDIAFASDGTMYLATDGTDPILVVDPTTLKVDVLYKGIIPSYCKRFAWGNASYLYLLSGDATAGQEWTIYRLDTGTTGGR